MPVLTAIIEGGIGWAVGRVGDKAAVAFMSRWNEKSAKAELIKVIEAAMESAVDEVPILAEELRSEIFVNNVVAPAVVHFLRDPSIGNPEEELAKNYIKRFVEPFLRGRSLQETLSQLFHTRQSDLERAFSLFLIRLRPALYESKYWRDPIRDQALEEVRSTVLHIKQQLASTTVTEAIDLDVARADAHLASQALRAWPQTIRGEHMERPELEVLHQRIRMNPYDCTLVIGESGAGKSALFAQLVQSLQSQGVVVFAIKADLLPPNVRTLRDVSEALGLRGSLIGEIEALARTAPVVVLIDQLDAVSEVMDRSSERMRLLLQVVHYFQDRKRAERVAPPVHILVSSRPFEASYDARFQSLNADVIQLALPSLEHVLALLERLQISAEDVPEALNETLRRPFALRIFVDILRRGVPGRELIASQLLSTWLTSANLGDSPMRRDVLAFLERLAAEMTECESLWRPADAYDIQDPQVVQTAVASGIVVRQSGLLGFSHQAWLDDFQAKNFSTGQSLANYAWQRQGGLFARATVLRSLQRLRTFDLPAYELAIDALLGSDNTRRHLRHLVVDLVAGQQQPSPREKGWLQHLVRSDVPLARRALARIAQHWADWREHLIPLLPYTMGSDDLRWNTIQLLVAEAAHDAESVARLISVHWGASERDVETIEVLSRSGLWSPSIVERLQLMFARQQFGDYLVVNYAEKLGDSRAAELLRIYLDHAEICDGERSRFHGLDKLFVRLPSAFARTLFPWFVRVACRGERGTRGRLDAYASSTGVPHGWSREDSENGIFGVVKAAFFSCAKEQPREFIALSSGYVDVEVAEVQALIAEGFAAGCGALANEGFEYLLNDSRRLHVGMEFRQSSDGVSYLVDGWSTLVLLRALIPHLDSEQFERLRDYIEAWNPYVNEVKEESDALTRRRIFGWAEGKRLKLLAMLPVQVLAPRRYRQVQEWRSTQPDLLTHSGPTMASAVQSPMSAQQMASASDHDVFRMIDEVGDDTEHLRGRHRSFRDGGTVELSRAFAEFGKGHPDRALRLAERCFQPGRHEYAGGELLRVVAEDPDVDAQRIRALVWKWHSEGFASEAWRRDVAWAYQHLAERNAGLVDEDVQLLESWIVNDPRKTTERIASRIALEERNRESNSHRRAEVKAVVFRRGLGGMHVLPQDNFTLLSAMASALLGRAEPSWNGWLSALERHVDRSEDPAIWTALLAFRGQPLARADGSRVKQLVQTIWDRFPDALSNTYIALFLWRTRDLLGGEVLTALRDRWLAGDDSRNRQAAGELLMAAVLVDPASSPVSAQLAKILDGLETPERLGALFTASTAWNEDSPGLQQGAHHVLMRFVRQASGHDAVAIAEAVSRRDSLVGDNFTKELLGAIAQNPQVLSACLNRRLTHDLQGLLLCPGFEELVLEVAERCTDLMFSKDKSSAQMSYGENFVSVSIALQRSMDPLRSRAMDLYERLLDGAAYGAEEAAKASLLRVE